MKRDALFASCPFPIESAVLIFPEQVPELRKQMHEQLLRAVLRDRAEGAQMVQ